MPAKSAILNPLARGNGVCVNIKTRAHNWRAAAVDLVKDVPHLPVYAAVILHVMSVSGARLAADLVSDKRLLKRDGNTAGLRARYVPGLLPARPLA